MIANAQCSNAAGEYASGLGIPISDELAVCLPVAVGFRELIGDPLSLWRRTQPKWA